MTSKSETLSIRTMATVIAVSALSLTTTLNTSGMTYNASPWAIMGNIAENDMGTTTLKPKTIDTKASSNVELAKELFAGEMRDFTREEAKIYQDSLKKIYKPIGVNIFDIC